MKFFVYIWRVRVYYHENGKSLLVSSELSLEKQLIRSRRQITNILMRFNKYLFNRVNNKERERGQRSVVWLKRGQP